MTKGHRDRSGPGAVGKPRLHPGLFLAVTPHAGHRMARGRAIMDALTGISALAAVFPGVLLVG
jgi:hypothetical protein